MLTGALQKKIKLIKVIEMRQENILLHHIYGFNPKIKTEYQLSVLASQSNLLYQNTNTNTLGLKTSEPQGKQTGPLYQTHKSQLIEKWF